MCKSSHYEWAMVREHRAGQSQDRDGFFDVEIHRPGATIASQVPRSQSWRSRAGPVSANVARQAMQPLVLWLRHCGHLFQPHILLIKYQLECFYCGTIVLTLQPQAFSLFLLQSGFLSKQLERLLCPPSSISYRRQCFEPKRLPNRVGSSTTNRRASVWNLASWNGQTVILQRVACTDVQIY